MFTGVDYFLWAVYNTITLKTAQVYKSSNESAKTNTLVWPIFYSLFVWVFLGWWIWE